MGIGVGRLWHFSAFVAFMRHAGWSVYLFINFLCGVAWRGVACSVYGALGWGPCGIHSVCNVYEAFGLVAFFVAFRVFVTFMGHWGGTLVAFTVFLLFMECWGWTFVAFTAFVVSIRPSGWWRSECLWGIRVGPLWCLQS